MALKALMLRQLGQLFMKVTSSISMLLIDAGCYNQNGIDVSIIELSPAIGMTSSKNTKPQSLVTAWRELQLAFAEVHFCKKLFVFT